MIILSKEKNRKADLSRFNSMKTEFKETCPQLNTYHLLAGLNSVLSIPESNFSLRSPKTPSDKH